MSHQAMRNWKCFFLISHKIFPNPEQRISSSRMSFPPASKLSLLTHRPKDLQVSFPSPEIEVDCGDAVFPEPCPTPVSIPIDGCEDSVTFNAGDIRLGSLGRILQLDATIKNICASRRSGCIRFPEFDMRQAKL